MKNEHTKKRIIIVYEMLKYPITVPEIQGNIEAILGIKPDRKTIYDDIANIECLHPLAVTRKNQRNVYQLLRH